MSRIPCEVMTAGIEEFLASRFGKDSVVGVLAGTELEQYSKDWGFGLCIVKAAVESPMQRDWAIGTRLAIEMAQQKRAANRQKKSHNGTKRTQEERPVRVGAWGGWRYSSALLFWIPEG